MSRHAANRYDYSRPIPGQQIAPVLRTQAPDADRYIRRHDQAAFAYTAWWFNVHILVRRSNPETLRYIGVAGFRPKGPETKAKTAHLTYLSPVSRKPAQVAGLVCDPTQPGAAAAFHPEKLAGARKEWAKFLQTGRLDTGLTWDATGTPSRAYLAPGCRFAVDTRPDSDRFGALMQTRYGGTQAMDWIHGDYDLFGIVPEDTPGENVVVAEQHLASPFHPLNRCEDGPLCAARRIPNFRGRDFMDVQAMLNRRIGVPMILHGSQEKAVDSYREEVDLFLPNGRDSCALLTEADLRRLYEVNLHGRPLHGFMAGTGGARRGLPGTLWQVTGAPLPAGVAASQVTLDQVRGAHFARIG